MEEDPMILKNFSKSQNDEETVTKRSHFMGILCNVRTKELTDKTKQGFLFHNPEAAAGLQPLPPSPFIFKFDEFRESEAFFVSEFAACGVTGSGERCTQKIRKFVFRSTPGVSQ